MSLPIIFEVGVLKQFDDYVGQMSDQSIVEAYSLLYYPMLPNPSSISWTNPPRDDIMQAPSGSVHISGGRGLAQCQMSGTFGIATRALGLVSGTGVERLKRFLNEVVALSSAITRADVDECIRNSAIGVTGVLSPDVTGGSVLTSATTEQSVSGAIPGNTLRSLLSKALPDGFDPRHHIFYVNVYDFINRKYHRVGKIQVSHSLSSRGGGAVEMQTYQCSFSAYGPPIVDDTGRKFPQAIQKLIDILGTWQRVNDAIASSTLLNLLDNIATLVNQVVVVPTSASLTAITAQLTALTALAGGMVVSSPGLSSLIGSTQTLASQFAEIGRILSGNDTYVSPDPTTDEIDWSQEVSDETLDTFVQTESVYQARDAAQFQAIAGRFLGMSDSEFASFLEAGGQAGGASPTVASSTDHVVTTLDTPESISRKYGVSWVDVVRLNRLLSDDLISGRVLQIPRIRTWGPQGLEGIPTFDSHVGFRVLGKDFVAPMIADSSGDYATVDGLDCLTQGVQFQTSEVAERILTGLDGLPTEAKAAIAATKARQIYETDPRVQGVSVAAETSDSGASIRLDVEMRAVNGVTGRLSLQKVGSTVTWR